LIGLARRIHVPRCARGAGAAL